MILVMWQKKVLKSSCQSCTCYKIAIVNTGFWHKAVMTKTLIVFHFLLT